MECPKCHSAVYDNRPKKLSGAFKPNAPDFKCSSKTCDWAQWPPKAGASPVQAPPPPNAPSASQAQGGLLSRDLLIQELFWDSFDSVLAGLAKRKLADWAKPETVAALTATQFIQRSKG